MDRAAERARDCYACANTPEVARDCETGPIVNCRPFGYPCVYAHIFGVRVLSEPRTEAASSTLRRARSHRRHFRDSACHPLAEGKAGRSACTVLKKRAYQAAVEAANIRIADRILPCSIPSCNRIVRLVNTNVVSEYFESPADHYQA